MIALEVRTFDQRFGDRCPFCNTTWGDPNPCGDSRADWTIRQSLDNATKINRAIRSAEAERRAADPVTIASRLARRREQNRLNVRAYRERNQHELVCEYDGQPFTSHKRGQRFCSRTHMMRARHAREELAA